LQPALTACAVPIVFDAICSIGFAMALIKQTTCLARAAPIGPISEAKAHAWRGL